MVVTWWVRGSYLVGEGGGVLRGTATLSRLETVLSLASPNRLSSSLIARFICILVASSTYLV